MYILDVSGYVQFFLHDVWHWLLFVNEVIRNQLEERIKRFEAKMKDLEDNLNSF